MKSKEERAKDSVYWDCDAQEYDVAVAQYLKGATEQEAIDDVNLADIKLMRDEYYCELQKLRQEKVEWLENACKYLEKYMERLGYIDEWCRSGEDDFCKAMEE